MSSKDIFDIYYLIRCKLYSLFGRQYKTSDERLCKWNTFCQGFVSDHSRSKKAVPEFTTYYHNYASSLFLKPPTVPDRGCKLQIILLLSVGKIILL